eukprot:2885124-Karenia_brevis.AAC.1
MSAAMASEAQTMQQIHRERVACVSFISNGRLESKSTAPGTLAKKHTLLTRRDGAKAQSQGVRGL